MKIESIRSFRKYIRKFERIIEAQNGSSCCCGVTIPQCHILMELKNSDTLTINELATNLNLDKSTISRTVDSLVNSGLLNREIPKENRRISNISLSGEGKKVHDQINEINDSFWESAIEDISLDKRDEFISLFEQFVRKLELSND